MSEREEKPVASEEPTRREAQPSAPLLPTSSSAHRCEHRVLLMFGVSLYFVASSSTFQNAVRKHSSFARRTHRRSGRDCILPLATAHFEAEADGVVIHGLEDPAKRLRKNRSPARGFQPAQSF